MLMALQNGHGLVKKLAKNLLAMALVLLALTSFYWALSLPFILETKTLWYKTGSDRLIYLGGQIAGMLAMVLFFWQIGLLVWGRVLKGVVATATTAKLHRILGPAVACTALVHAFLILLPEGLTNLPMGRRHWPEMVGMALLLVLLSTVIISLLRSRLAMSYPRWRFYHRLSGYLAIWLVVLHVAFVSESFAGIAERAILLGFSLLLLSRIIWLRLVVQ